MPAGGPTRIIFLGSPGAGKGTQAARLSAERELVRISTGDMLRQAIADGTSLGKQAAPIMDRGQLVPDDLLIAMIRERVSRDDCQNGYILDGFPRTMPQAHGLENIAGREADDRFFVFNVEVPRAELVRRLSGRRWCPKCQSTYHVDSNPPTRQGVCDWCSTALVQREDDKESVVARRLKEYDERTKPLIQYYKNHARFHSIDGNRPADVVLQELLGYLEGQR
jgi:adenylate kinase